MDLIDKKVFKDIFIRLIMRMNKRGLSGIVTALILIVLVLVAAGIVWAVYNSLIKGSAEDTEFNSKCLGVSLDVTKLSCDETECTANVERSIGSNQDFDGADAVFIDADGTQAKGTLLNNIAVKGIIHTDEEESVIDATEVQIRIYFNKKDGISKFYCSPAIVYEKP